MPMQLAMMAHCCGADMPFAMNDAQKIPNKLKMENNHTTNHEILS